MTASPELERWIIRTQQAIDQTKQLLRQRNAALAALRRRSEKAEEVMRSGAWIKAQAAKAKVKELRIAIKLLERIGV